MAFISFNFSFSFFQVRKVLYFFCFFFRQIKMLWLNTNPRVLIFMVSSAQFNLSAQKCTLD